MAIDYIPITTTGNPRAQRLLRAVKLCREAIDKLEEVKDTMEHHINAPSYASIEGSTGYGIPAGEGETLYNLVAGAYARINHIDITGLIDRVDD